MRIVKGILFPAGYSRPAICKNRLYLIYKRLKAKAEPVADDGALMLQHLVPHMRSEAEKFDSQLWASMVERIMVGVDGGLTVVFRDGTEII